MRRIPSTPQQDAMDVFAGLPRTVLLGPAPIGIGTEHVEALSSYFTRMVQHNGVTPGFMIWSTRWPTRPVKCLDLGVFCYATWSTMNRGTISTTLHGLTFVQATSRLIGVASLPMLNWHMWCEGFSTTRLTRPFQSWCIKCLIGDKVKYIREAWTLSCVTVCALHRVRLADRCPRCRSKIRVVEANGRLLWCRACRSSVLDMKPAPSCRAQRHEIVATSSLCKLLAMTTGGKQKISASVIFKALRKWARQNGASSIRERAAFFGFSKATLSSWANRKSKPSLQCVLEMCCRKGQPIHLVFFGSPLSATAGISDNWLQSRWRYRRIDDRRQREIRESLRKLTRQDRRLTLAQVGRKIGVATKTLKRLAPTITRKILISGKLSTSDSSEHHFDQFKATIRRLILDEMRNDRVPSRRQLEKHFEKPGWFRERKRSAFVRAALNEAREGFAETRIHMPNRFDPPPTRGRRLAC